MGISKSIVMLNLVQHLYYDIVQRFRNKFGMTLYDELIWQLHLTNADSRVKHGNDKAKS